MGNFRELIVWQRAKDLAVIIYRTTAKGEFSKDYGLRDQIRRAGVSIASNIAEGDELGPDKQSVNFFYTARGSSAEIGYLAEKSFSHIENDCQNISKMLNNLIKSRSKN